MLKIQIKSKRYLIAIAICFATISCSKPEPSDSSLEQLGRENNSKQPEVIVPIERCKVSVPQEGRDEPRFRGLTGYLGFARRYHNLDGPKKFMRSPWKIPTLFQSGTGVWNESKKTLDGKSKVTVVSQNLKHETHGRYDGALTVELENGDSALVSPKYFIPVDWWNCGIEDAIKYAPVIAEVLPDAKPLDRDGRWRKMKSFQKVLCTDDRPPSPRFDDELIACETSDRQLFFERKSLRIIY